MAYVNSRSSSASIFGRISAFFGQLQADANRRVTYRRTVKVLSAMTDRELADIGISRISIEDVARASVKAQ